jgi:alanine-alpha-ketoisovalerate/valine-pyruvate aminotransferase
MNSIPENNLFDSVLRFLFEPDPAADRFCDESVDMPRQAAEASPLLSSGGKHHLPMQQSYLDDIVRQVLAEGYYVERISSFGIGQATIEKRVKTINDWASSVNFKVGFNYTQDICVFEKA